MKRVLIALMMVVPMICSAQFKYKEVKTNPKYLTGAVSTTANGMVYLQRTIEAPGMTVEQIMTEVDRLFANVMPPARYIEVERTNNMRIYRMQDELVFKRNFLSTNVATMSGRLVVKAGYDVCTITLDNIVYWSGNNSASTTTGMPHERWTSGWSVSDTGVEVITAEESISDKEAVKTAINKKKVYNTYGANGGFNAQTEEVRISEPSYEYLTRWSAKYRVKTIDYMDSVAAALQKILDK
jgi:hypothetical protein